MAELICEHCGKANPEGEYYCLACGNLLPGANATVSTHYLSDERQSRPHVRWGTAYFGERMILQLYVHNANCLLETRFGERCILGRATPESPVDVDLTPYGAHEHGVSRQHVRLTREYATVMVEDLGSANGTFLNGMRLIPFQPRVLRDNDELWLGKLALRISFRQPPSKLESCGLSDQPSGGGRAAPEPGLSPGQPRHVPVTDEEQEQHSPHDAGEGDGVEDDSGGDERD